MAKTCTHQKDIKKVTPSGKGCKECLEMGDTWVHLRLCLRMWPRGLLRLLEEQACHQAFSPDQAPSNTIV